MSQSHETSPLLGQHSSSLSQRSRSLGGGLNKRVGWRKSILNLQRTFSRTSFDEYEGDDRRQAKDYDPTGLQHELANSVGVRTWTASYASIDWLHDEVNLYSIR